MTREELESLPFAPKSHVNKRDEHCMTYGNDEYGIYFCDHVPYKDGEPCGTPFRHFMFNGKVYKSWEKFLDAVKDIKLKE